MQIFEWLKQLPKDAWGNGVETWAVAVGVFAASWLVLRVLKSIFLNRARHFAERYDAKWLDLLTDLFDSTKWWFLMVLGLYFGSLVLAMEDRARNLTWGVAVLVLLLQAAMWGNRLIDFFIVRYAREKAEAGAQMPIAILGFLSRLAMWTLIVLLALDNMGVDVTALVAGLGIGGIAVALAVQNILGDLLASLSIFMDRPFEKGDFIIVGDFMGTVEKVGVKTTRIRSLSGEQLIFSNNDLLTSRIRNYKRMDERRILFSVGVTYDTPHEKLTEVSKIISEIIEAQEQTRLDRVHFKSFGDSALIYEAVYYMLKPDYNLYMDTQQAINVEIYRRFGEEGLEFAFPTQTIHVHQESVPA